MVIPMLGKIEMQYIDLSEHILKDQVLKPPTSPNLPGNIFSMWQIKRKEKH